LGKIAKKTLLLAGGVGGARMAQGLLRLLEPDNLTIIANVGDDAHFYDLLVCPDIDTLLYTLSNRIDWRQGWGIEADTIGALTMLETLGAPVWMKLGDGDFGLHIWRNWQLRAGKSLSEVTQQCADRFGIKARIIPATEDKLRTRLRLECGFVDFQDWFVKQSCQPRIHEIRYDGAELAHPPVAALQAIAQAELIILAPSNPYLSLLPILALKELRQQLADSHAPKIGVSPLVGGKAVKGPLDKLLLDLGKTGGMAEIIDCYYPLLDGFVIDRQDSDDIAMLERNSLKVLASDILIKEPEAATRLAREICIFADQFGGAS